MKVRIVRMLRIGLMLFLIAGGCAFIPLFLHVEDPTLCGLCSVGFLASTVMGIVVIAYASLLVRRDRDRDAS